jgi:Arc/MetJ-type ribon-helix-helix transcriptional regulator
MAVTVVLEGEAAQIVERQLADGRYPDAGSAVTAALLLLEDSAIVWSDIDVDAVKQMIAEADAEGGEVSISQAMLSMDEAIRSATRR